MTVTRLRAEDLLDESEPPRARIRGGVPRRRRLAGAALAVVAIPLLTLLLDVLDDGLTIESVSLIYLLVVVAVSAVGGTYVGAGAALAAVVLTNFFFVVPRHSLAVAQADQAIALAVFLAVSVTVSVAFDLAARRARAAALAGEQARALAQLGRGRLDDDSTLADVLAHARDTFGMESVVLRARRDDGWVDVETAGAPSAEAPVRFDVAAAQRLRLVGRGPALFAEDQRVLRAFADAARIAYEGRRLSHEADAAAGVAAADRQRVAILSAVGHDLRTPLATIKASTGALRADDTERDALLGDIDGSVERLERVVENLLDASRLEAGALSVHAQPVGIDEVVGATLLGVAGGQRVAVELPDDLPWALADAGLLERVLVNLVDNALRHGGGEVTVRALATTSQVKLEVSDRGPGLRPGAPSDGLGLGLSVARGFVEAMNGTLIADPSERAGLTMRITLPLAP